MVDPGKGMDDWSMYLSIPCIFASKLALEEIFVNEPVPGAGGLSIVTPAARALV